MYPQFSETALFFPHLYSQSNGNDVTRIKSGTPTLKGQSELGHLLYKYVGRYDVNNLKVSISGDQNKGNSHVNAVYTFSFYRSEMTHSLPSAWACI